MEKTQKCHKISKNNCKLPKFENKKIIKHAALRPYKHNELDSTVYIQSKTPFMSAVKRIKKIIEKFDKIPNKKNELIPRGNVSPKIKFVTVKGMGKSISKVTNIGIHFKFEEKCKVEVITKTVSVLDEFVNDPDSNTVNNSDGEDEDDENILRKRNIGAVEVRIFI